MQSLSLRKTEIEKKMVFKLSLQDNEPIYKQLILRVERALHEGELKAGEMLPSMNELAASLGISRETVKKAYNILTERGLIIPRHGKGFFAADVNADIRPQVLVIFDKISVYKQILFNALGDRLGAGVRHRLHARVRLVHLRARGGLRGNHDVRRRHRSPRH